MHAYACICMHCLPACLALEFSSSLSLSLSTATAGWMCENRGQSISRSLENQCARAGHGPWTSVARATLLEARHLHPRGLPRKLQCRLLPAPVRSGRPARSTRERASAKKRRCRALSKQAKAFTQAGAREALILSSGPCCSSSFRCCSKKPNSLACTCSSCLPRHGLEKAVASNIGAKVARTRNKAGKGVDRCPAGFFAFGHDLGLCDDVTHSLTHSLRLSATAPQDRPWMGGAAPPPQTVDGIHAEAGRRHKPCLQLQLQSHQGPSRRIYFSARRLL